MHRGVYVAPGSPTLHRGLKFCSLAPGHKGATATCQAERVKVIITNHIAIAVAIAVIILIIITIIITIIIVIFVVAIISIEPARRPVKKSLESPPAKHTLPGVSSTQYAAQESWEKRKTRVGRWKQSCTTSQDGLVEPLACATPRAPQHQC